MYRYSWNASSILSPMATKKTLILYLFFCAYSLVHGCSRLSAHMSREPLTSQKIMFPLVPFCLFLFLSLFFLSLFLSCSVYFSFWLYISFSLFSFDFLLLFFRRIIYCKYLKRIWRPTASLFSICFVCVIGLSLPRYV